MIEARRAMLSESPCDDCLFMSCCLPENVYPTNGSCVPVKALIVGRWTCKVVGYQQKHRSTNRWQRCSFDILEVGCVSLSNDARHVRRLLYLWSEQVVIQHTQLINR